MTEYTVALTFDKDAAKALFELQKKIAEISGNSFLLEQRMPPHITLSLFEGEAPPLDVLHAFANAKERIPLSFACVGAFAGQSTAVLALPVVTDELMTMHRRLHNALKGCAASFGENYTAPNWVPHCTLAMRLDEAERDAAMSAAMGLFKPIRAVGMAVSVVEYPYRVVEGYALKEKCP